VGNLSYAGGMRLGWRIIIKGYKVRNLCWDDGNTPILLVEDHSLRVPGKTINP
jgi:hypothetical protein